MNQLDITGYKVVTLTTLYGNLQAVEQQIQQMQRKRQELAGTFWSELSEEGQRQGVDVPEGADVNSQNGKIVVTWPDAPEPEPEPGEGQTE